MLENKINPTLPRCKDSGILFLNFTNEIAPHFSCRNHCRFCSWNALDYAVRLAPSDESISEYVNNYFIKPPRIQLSGGGDPLYNYSHNKVELLRIIKCLKSNNVASINIITKEYNIAAAYWATELADVDSWSFSCQELNSQLRDLMQAMISAGKKVFLSYIVNENKHPDYERCINFIEYYDLPNLRITLRRNFNFPAADCNLIWKEVLKNKKFGGLIHIERALPRLSHICLMNDAVYHTLDIQMNLIKECEKKHVNWISG